MGKGLKGGVLVWGRIAVSGWGFKVSVLRCLRALGITIMIWGGSSIAVPTWTPKVCRIIAFYRYWAIFLPLLGVWVLQKATEISPALKETDCVTCPSTTHCAGNPWNGDFSVAVVFYCVWHVGETRIDLLLPTGIVCRTGAQHSARLNS